MQAKHQPDLTVRSEEEAAEQCYQETSSLGAVCVHDKNQRRKSPQESWSLIGLRGLDILQKSHSSFSVKKFKCNIKIWSSKIISEASQSISTWGCTLSKAEDAYMLYDLEQWAYRHLYQCLLYKQTAVALICHQLKTQPHQFFLITRCVNAADLNSFSFLASFLVLWLICFLF